RHDAERPSGSLDQVPGWRRGDRRHLRPADDPRASPGVRPQRCDDRIPRRPQPLSHRGERMNPRLALGPTTVIVNTLAFWLAMGIAATVWWPLYQDVHFVIAVAVTVALGSLIAILRALLRWSPVLVAL